jgi:putative transposase
MVLDILLLEHRDTDAAQCFFEKLLKDHAFVPEKIVTDQLGAYEAAWKQIPALENVKHVFVKSAARLNNRIERDHEHVREKQRVSRGWRSPPDTLETVLRCRDFTWNVFRKRRRSAGETREAWHQSFQVWGEVLSRVSPG